MLDAHAYIRLGMKRGPTEERAWHKNDVMGSFPFYHNNFTQERKLQLRERERD